MITRFYPYQILFIFLIFVLVMSSCGPATPTATTVPQPTNIPLPINSPSPEPTISGEKIAQSSLARIQSPNVPADDLSQLAKDDNAFALALYHDLQNNDGNLFLSPYSISMALAMTYAGAKGQTTQQMAQALHFSLLSDRLHPALNALDQTITAYANTPSGENTGFRLDVANSIWGQNGFKFLQSYLDLIAQDYGAGLHLVDFRGAPEASRKIINDWVSQQTQNKIIDLFPAGSIQDTTRLVLANAIYFKAAWDETFDPAGTKNGPFNKVDGSQTSVPMMHSKSSAFYQYYQGEGVQAVGLPYASSSVEMVIVMPSGDFNTFESGLTNSALNGIFSGLSSSPMNLTMPKFKIESTFDLKAVLASLGMPDAFDSSKADLSGMDGTTDLFISDVLHKAYVNVDENGTEAAAATGVVVGVTALPANPVNVTINHPFLFFIYDPQTNTILFMGRVLDPGK